MGATHWLSVGLIIAALWAAARGTALWLRGPEVEPCLACGRDVADTVTRCPHCAHAAFDYAVCHGLEGAAGAVTRYTVLAALVLVAVFALFAKRTISRRCGC